MAWEARLGLKQSSPRGTASVGDRLNGLGSPSGIETASDMPGQGKENHRLNGLGSPSGIETLWLCIDNAT